MDIYRNPLLHTSGKIAKARTELTIAADRLDCSPDEMQQMQEEIVNILEKYISFDHEISAIQMKLVYELGRGIRDVKTIQIK